MSKHSKKVRRITAVIRPGDGVAIDIVRRAAPRPDGTTAVEIGLDLSDAPVPERRYMADVASVLSVDDSARVLFGQRNLDGKSLRSLVIIVLTPEAVRNFLATCVEFMPKLSAYLDRIHAAKATLTEIKEEPQQTVQMAASIIAAAHVERDACMDFYHASPSALRAVLHNGDANAVGVDPVVRIQLSTRLLAAVVGGITEMSTSLPLEVESNEGV